MSNVPNIDSLPNNGGSVNYNLSLRDYFAAKAMAARAGDHYGNWDRLAYEAYAIADAMLRERSEEAK